jgi:YidC/Oxa1 family membrane protein insertase
MALSLAVLFAWSFLNPQKPAPAGPEAPTGAQAAAPAQPSGPAQPAPAVPAAPAPPPDAPEELVTLHGDGFHVVLTSHGGAVAHVVLDGAKYQREQEGSTVQVDLVRTAPGQPALFATAPSPELGGAADPEADPWTRSAMRIVSKDERSVVFEGRAGPLTVKKAYRLTGKPFELSVQIDAAGGDRPGALAVVFPASLPPNAKKGGLLSPPLDLVRPVCRAGDKTERFTVDGSDTSKQPPGDVSWIGVDHHYFVAAAFPQPAPAGTCLFTKGATAANGAAVGGASLLLPLEGGGRKVTLTAYAGPKDVDTLRAYGREFSTAIELNWMANLFSFFARPILLILRFFHGIFGNWGVAIILLTITVKLVLYPLTAKSMQSMNEMRRLQPEIEKLKQKYGNDRERMSMEQMKLFQQHKVNPLGGCLPMLLQLPIWFALYATLQTSVELYREPFLWVKNLTAHDPYFILPLATGALMFVQQKISPQPADNAQAKMMLYFMPIMFTGFMIFVAAGLSLYILVNSALSIIQQQWMMKRMPPPPATAVAKG